jgi:hypothetical protein
VLGSGHCESLSTFDDNRSLALALEGERAAPEIGGCVNRRIGERRINPRFEVVGGELWGRLETVASLVVRNIGLHGALLYGRAALPPGSTQLVTTDVDGQPEQLRVRVTRCHPAADSAGGFDIGIEFVTLSTRMRVYLDQWIASGGLPEATA